MKTPSYLSTDPRFIWGLTDLAFRKGDRKLLSRPIDRLMEYLKKVGQAGHSKAMQYTHNSAEQMKKAVQTLVQMGYVQVINEEIERTGAGSIMKTEYKWIGPK